jgi:hypothetical protein
LTGGLAEATGWRRVPPDVRVNRRTALLQDLLRGMAELGAIAARPEGRALRPDEPGRADVRRARPSGRAELDAFRSRARVVAEEAIRIDAASAPLRTVATELQRAADAAEDSTRSAALAAASAAASSEARRAQAGAPLASPSIAPGLSGAFADAMRRGR